MVIIKRFDTTELIEDACALLYREYIETGSWIFSNNNPSELKIITKNNRQLLVDRITSHAIWFGAFDSDYSDKLVGCLRLFKATKNIPFEIETYPTAKEVVRQYIEINKPNLYEASRACVDSEYKGKNILALLYLGMTEYCQEEKSSVFGSVSNGYAKSVLRRIGWPCKKEEAFKFEESDSGAVNFYFTSYKDHEIANMIKNIKSLENARKKKSLNILDALNMVAQIFPAPMYWHDTKGIVLGVNIRCLKDMGKSIEEVLGKTPYELYPKEIADYVWKNSEQVFKNGEALSQEEYSYDISGKVIGTYLSIKTPLYDEDGQVLGVLGTSINITAEKEAERLKIANEKQQTLLEQEEKFRKVANKVAHDIQSPLSSLSTIVKNCVAIPETQRIALREAAINIKDIANYLLVQYEKKESEAHGPEERRAILVSMVLSEILSSKKYQYEKRPIQFNIHFNPDTQFAFIRIGQSAFKRMLSNLINNAVDACEGNPGTVKVTLIADNEWVKIVILDSGKGMPQEIHDKIMNKIAFTAGKQSGHGIGLTQVWETLEDNQGELDIDSTSGQGTTITLTFPRISAPNWIAEKIVLNQNDTVVILDDDSSIHGAWDMRFEPILKQHTTLQVKHFNQGSQALKFIHGLDRTDKEHVFLLSDYELINQNLNGLEVIAETRIEHAILVTSHYANAEIQKEALKTGTRILPKELVSEVSMQILTTEEQNALRDRCKQVEMVIVDDNPAFTKTVAQHILWDKVTDQYNSPEEFLKNAHRYTRDTKIYLDNNYDNSFLRGLDIAKELHEKGFKQLYLLSGDIFEPNEIPDYLSVIKKADIDNIREL